MKTKSLAVVAVKITGIVFLVIGLFRLPYSVIVVLQYQLYRGPDEGSAFVALFTVIAYGVIFGAGLFFLFAGEKVGAFISRDESEASLAVREKELLRVAIAIIGACVLAIALPRLAGNLTEALIARRLGLPPIARETRLRYLPGLIASAVQTVIGAWLFFGSRGVAGIHDRLRRAGMKKEKKAAREKASFSEDSKT